MKRVKIWWKISNLTDSLFSDGYINFYKHLAFSSLLTYKIVMLPIHENHLLKIFI